MKIVIAIDSFKGSLSSVEAGNAAAEGIKRVFPNAGTLTRPVADGGISCLQALASVCSITAVSKSDLMQQDSHILPV